MEISRRVEANRGELDVAQLTILSSATHSATIELVHRLYEELAQIQEAERDFYKQHAKVQWICEMGQGTKFFYSMVNVKNKRQSITSLVFADGSKLETQDAIASEVVSFFTSLIDAKDLGVVGVDISFVRDFLSFIMPNAIANLL
ncbi:hypothetical protein V6N13_051022 [Hibiscus sabdariffa]